MDILQMSLSSLLNQRKDAPVEQQVIPFCTKPPKMKVIPECVADHETGRDAPGEKMNKKECDRN